MYILVGVVNRSLALLNVPSTSVRQPGREQWCRRNPPSRVFPVRTRIVCFLCRPGMSFHRGRGVRALHVEHKACLLLPLAEKSSGFSPVIELVPLMMLIKLPATLKFLIFAFRRRYMDDVAI